ncbi:hypothetical protein EVU96_08990 [Bacillus infantis]|uniref:AimR family lysis-lysogeny pheromone receptor n=1 Tax=Bacillus infantis TaxID=324767 RepID=UPI00101BBB81|nr:AimR family lysis-lysogeny pheromone receptor [Bacillus infantis]RYI30540.1 hypothetical protein EVU96_08990 [Bacillus infantis]
MEEQKGLRQMLINRLESERGLPTKMAKLAGYSSSGALMKVLRKVDGDIEKFDGFVRIVHELFPEDKFDLMFEFAKTLNPNRMTARFMIEYAALYGKREMKLTMIEALGNSENDESKDWAFVYGIDHKLILKEIDEFEAITQLTQRKFVSPEMKVFSKIVQYYSFEDMRNLKMMEKLYNTIKIELETINNQFAKSSFLARLFLIEGDIRLRNKQVSKVKQNIFFIENALDPIKYFAYLTVGNSYIISNYEKSKELLLKCLDNSSGGIEHEAQNSFNFLSVLWEKFDDYKFNGDISNELFYHAKKGNKEKAIEILEQIDVENLSDYSKGFNYYYQGILFKDATKFYKSIKHFNLSSDKFYKTLAIMELEKMGVDQDILEVFSA